MDNDVLPSGSLVIDKLLNGGYPKKITTCIYGEAGSGKTTLCMLAQISAALSKKKVLYFDTEQNFSVERLKQLTAKADKVMENTLFFKPKSFKEQDNCICSLDRFNSANIGLIIFDSIVSLYRLELNESSEKKEINNSFNRQLASLSDFYKYNDIPIIVTSTVYSTVEGKEQKVMSGGNILNNRAKCHIELIKERDDLRAAILKKHPTLPKDKMVEFRIKTGGLEELKN